MYSSPMNDMIWKSYAGAMGEGGGAANRATLEALGVPLIGDGTGALRAALRASVARTTAPKRCPVREPFCEKGNRPYDSLSVKRRAASGRGLGGGVGAAARARSVPDRGTRVGERLDAIVDAHGRIEVVVLVSSGETGHGAGRAAAAVGDLDLGAGDVVLRLLHMGTVDACNAQISLSRRPGAEERNLPMCSNRMRYSPLGVPVGIFAPT
jgi:hypothetical protein